MSDDSKAAAGLSNLFLHLKTAAKQLNAASDDLAKPVARLDSLLKTLNLGITAWCRVDKYEDDENEGSYSFHDLGYARVEGKWGIALREGTGFSPTGREDCETWLFNDGPRRLRIKAVDHLPDLIQKLTEEATRTANTLKSKVGLTQQVVEAVAGPERK